MTISKPDRDELIEEIKAQLPCSIHNEQIKSIAADVSEIKIALLGAMDGSPGLLQRVASIEKTLECQNSRWGIWHVAAAGVVVAGLAAGAWAIIQHLAHG